MRLGRWVGIDEAGYGPNLGPLVMSYVSASGPLETPPDLWNDLAATVCRAGDRSERLWVDDSKALYPQRQGRHRLESATLAALDACGRDPSQNLRQLVHSLGAGELADVELDRWLEANVIPVVPSMECRAFVDSALGRRPFDSAHWRLECVRSAVFGPERFNRALETTKSKADVHFKLFASLLGEIWTKCADGVETSVRCDKHGGRHFYLERLQQTFPGVWIDRGVEGPASSVYRLREGERSMTVEFCPKADATCGFTALASIASKWLRECWMDVFNAFWQSRVADLRPTAGYPLDAARFRLQIEPAARNGAIDESLWWRRK